MNHLEDLHLEFNRNHASNFNNNYFSEYCQQSTNCLGLWLWGGGNLVPKGMLHSLQRMDVPVVQ